MTPPAMSTPSQEGVSHPLLNVIIWNHSSPPINLPEYVGSLPDGSYVSVPSPLGKIKSMTKGSELEQSAADSLPTHAPHTPHITVSWHDSKCHLLPWEGSLIADGNTWLRPSERVGGVNRRPVSICVIFKCNIWETIDLNVMNHRFKAWKHQWFNKTVGKIIIGLKRALYWLKLKKHQTTLKHLLLSYEL